MEQASVARSRWAVGLALGLALGCSEVGATRGDAAVAEDTPETGDAVIDRAEDAPDTRIEAPDVTEPDADVAEVADLADVAERDADVADVADAPRDRSRDLVLGLGGWSLERGRRAEFRLVDRDGALASLVVLRAVTSGSERFVLADAMGAAPDRLDWYIDRDGDGRYGDSDTASHAAAPTAPPYALTVTPEAAPGAPAPLPADRTDLVGHLAGFEVHAGVRFELTVTAVGSERTVALFRDQAMSGAGTLDVRLPNVLREGVAYRVFFFIDLNDNGVYDVHGDHGSSLDGTATASGLTFSHDHHTNTSRWE